MKLEPKSNEAGTDPPVAACPQEAATESLAAPGARPGPGRGTAVITLALDLGTHTGSARLVDGKVVASGTKHLASEEELVQQRKCGQERTGDIRFYRCMDFVAETAASGAERLVIEDVIFVRDQAQAQLWASLRAAVWAVGRSAGIPVKCVPVATLKKFACGDGSADKSQMAAALARAMPAHYVANPVTGVLSQNGREMDDNEVDAIWVALFAAAVDRGEQQFLSVYEKKTARKLEQRARKAAAKADKKARKEAEEADHRALVATIKALGKCCGVFRRPASHGRAICPNCYTAIRFPKTAPAQ
jgi:Holliday junction resolvasome RuvABC endonuclease subunit